MKRRLGGAALAVLALIASGTATAAASVTTTATGWHAVRAPDPHHDTSLSSVSCSGPDACTAVGEASVGSGTISVSSGGGTSSSSGATQRVKSVAAAERILRAREQEQLLSRALTTTSPLVTAKTRAYHGFAIAERWNGTIWTLQKLPRIPKTEFTELTSVSCPAANECVAVGDYATRNYNDHPLSEIWNGVSWRRVAINQVLPTSVSCITADDCIAAGYINGPVAFASGERMRPEVEIWNGHRWRVSKLARGGSNQFVNVSTIACVSATSCEAYGSREAVFAKAFTFHTFAEGWNGTRWAVQTTPTIPGTKGDFNLFGSLACSTPDHCVAVGYAASDHSARALVEVWDGARWAREVIPHASRTLLAGAGCIAGGDCTLVGVRVEANAEYAHTAVYGSAGSGWALETTPTVKGNERGFSAVAPAGAHWIAVGSKRAGALVEER